MRIAGNTSDYKSKSTALATHEVKKQSLATGAETKPIDSFLPNLKLAPQSAFGSATGSILATAAIFSTAQVIDSLIPGNIVGLHSLGAVSLGLSSLILGAGVVKSLAQSPSKHYPSSKQSSYSSRNAAEFTTPIQGAAMGSLAGIAIGSALGSLAPPGLGLIAQAGTTAIGGALGWKIGNSMKKVSRNLATIPFHKDDNPKLSASQAPKTDSAQPSSPSKNNIQVLFNDQALFQDAMKEIKHAKKSIRFESYLFNGPDGKAMADLLIEKAKEGVDVKVILDPFVQQLEKTKRQKNAANPEQYNLGEYLKQNGVNYTPYALDKLTGSLTPSEHAKILIVDEHITYLGGTNIDDTYNQDTNVKIIGPAGKGFSKFFDESWQVSQSKNPLTLGSTTDHSIDDPRIQAFSTSPSRSTIKKAIINNIQEAQESIRVQMFTLTDDTIVGELVKAADRGVNVELLLGPNKRIFHLPTFHAPNIAAALTAKKNNIKVKWFENDNFSQMHSKVMTFDGKKTMLGSLNGIHNAFRGIHEYYASIEDPEITQTINEQFDHMWKNESAPVKSNIGYRILGALVETLDKLIL